MDDTQRLGHPVNRLSLLVKQIMTVRRETLTFAIASLITAPPHTATNASDHFGCVTVVKRTNNDFIVLDEANKRVGIVNAKGESIPETRPLPPRF